MIHLASRPFGRAPVTLALIILAASAIDASTVTARAKDLPRRAAPPPVADRCSALGTGFHPVAGSDTCIRLSGSVEVGAVIATGGGGAGAWMGRDTRR